MIRTRVGLALATGVVGAVGLLGLAGCRTPQATGTAGTGDSSTLSVEGQALAAIGYEAAELGPAENPAENPAANPAANVAEDPAPVDAPSAAPSGPAAGPSARAARKGRHPLLRRGMLRRNTLHGEATVQTKDGVKVVDVQRGTVTAIDATSMTVKSTDGFTMTWKFGTPLRVIEHRGTVRASAVKVGTKVGVAGTKDGGTTTARLILIPEKQ
jgi:hypothetical protein